MKAAATSISRAAAPAWSLPIPLLMGMAGVLLALRLGLVLFVAPMGDEAYYWMWGQRPDLSYFDHPPLNAWLMWVSSRLFGWSLFSLRLPSWLTLAGTAYLLSLFARQLGGTEWRRHFWATLVVFLASPLFFIYSAIMLPDHLLILLSLVALYCLTRFFVAWDLGESGGSFDLFVGAAAIGLAGLTKYNAVFLGLGVVLMVLSTARRRQLLGDWRIYAAGAISVALQTPVLLWNAANGFASLKLHLVDRQNLDILGSLSTAYLVSFVLQTIILGGPFLIVPTIMALIRRSKEASVRSSRALSAATFAVSAGSLTLVSLTNFVSVHWNVLAHVAILPLLARTIGQRWLLIGHFLYGTLVAGLLVANYTIVPVIGASNLETYVAYGWKQIGEEVAAAAARYHPDFLAGSRYTLAAQLGFELGRTDVTSLSQRPDQYDFWFDAGAHLGQTALILGDTGNPLEPIIAERFDSVEVVRTFEIVQNGMLVNGYQLYLAKGYRGPPAAAPVYRP